MAQSKYKIILSVVEMGSLTRAAEKCGVTQSAVSHALQALESEAGFPLIIRNRSGVRLTPEGEKLLPVIRRIVQALDSYHAQTQSLRSSEGGCIRIGAFTSVAVHWLPRIIKEYQAQHPAVDFRMLGGDYHDIAQGFASGSIDVGFVTREMNIPAVETLPLTEDRLLAVLPKDHPLAGQQRIAAAQLASEPFISLMENSNQDARSVLEAAGVQVEVKYTAKDDYAILAMVEAGLGIALNNTLNSRERGRRMSVLPLAPRQSVEIGIAAVHDASPAVRLFLKALLGALEQKNGLAPTLS